MKTKVGFDTWATSVTTKYINVGFRPKVIFFMTNHDVAYNTGTADVDLSFGMTDTTDSVAFYMMQLDGTSPRLSITAKRWHHDGAVMTLGSTGGETAYATLLSVDDNGFTLDFPMVTGTAYKFAYMVWGGDEFQNVKLGSFPIDTYNAIVTETIGFLPSSFIALSDMLPGTPDNRLCFSIQADPCSGTWMSNFISNWTYSGGDNQVSDGGFDEQLVPPSPPFFYRGTKMQIYNPSSTGFSHQRQKPTNAQVDPVATNPLIYYLALQIQGDNGGAFGKHPIAFSYTNGVRNNLINCGSPKAGLFYAPTAGRQDNSGSATFPGGISIGFVDENNNQACYSIFSNYDQWTTNTWLAQHANVDDHFVWIFNQAASGAIQKARTVIFDNWTPKHFEFNQDYVVTGYSLNPVGGFYYWVGNYIVGEVPVGQQGVVV